MKRQMRIFAAFLIMLMIPLVFIGCSSSKNDSAAYETAVATTTGAYRGDEGQSGEKGTSGSPGSVQNTNPVEKMIYTARISIETLDFEKTLADIEAYILSLGGFIENSSISGIGDKFEDSPSSQARGYAEIVYRVPAPQYAGLLVNIKDFGNVISQSSSTQNITSAYYDLEGRLNAYRVSEKRLLEILAKAGDVKDMLEIERELVNVRANIEGMTTQMKAWDSMVDYSTVVISVREVRQITDTSDPETFGGKLLQTIKRSFNGFVDFLKGAVLVIVYLLPYAIIAAAGFFLYLKFRKKKKS